MTEWDIAVGNTPMKRREGQVVTLKDFARAGMEETEKQDWTSAEGWDREFAAGVLRAVAASAHELAGDPLSDNESFKAGWREACAYLQIVLERIAAESTQA